MMLRSRIAPIAAGFAAAFPLLSCVHDIAAPEQTLWQATLAGSPEVPTITGSAAAISRATTIEASIQVGGLADGTYEWRFREGDCTAPGQGVGSAAAYPNLVADEGSPTVSTEVVITGRMPADRMYHAEVRRADGNEALACGTFSER